MCHQYFKFFRISVLLGLLLAQPIQLFAKPAPQENLGNFSKAKTTSREYSDALEKMGWFNPTPSYRNLGLSDQELISLVGDTIVIAQHNPRTIDVPYYGDMVRWKGARFTTAFTKLPLSAEAVREKIIENDLNNGWRDYIPFVEQAEVIHKSEKHIAMRYTVLAEILFVKAKVEGVFKDILEDDGSISSVYLYGSAQIVTRKTEIPLIPKSWLSPVPMSNVRRWEFIPISTNESLVVLTDWAEVSDKSALSSQMTIYNEKMQKAEISDEDLAGPYPFPALGLFALKTVLLNQLDKVPESQTRIRETLSIPDFSKTENKEVLEKLIKPYAPVVFVHPTQRLSLDYGDIPFHFVTAVNKVDAEQQELGKFASQQHRQSEYMKQFRFTKLVGGNADLPDFENEGADLNGPVVHYQIKLGNGIPGLTSFKINYWMNYRWENPNRLSFTSEKGDIEEIYGAVEWYPAIEANKTLLFHTGTSDTGPNPKFPLSIMKKVPGSDVFSGIMSNVLSVGRQSMWINEQVKTSSP